MRPQARRKSFRACGFAVPEKARRSGDQADRPKLEDLAGAAESVSRLLAAIEAGELTAPAREVARLEGAYVALRAVEGALQGRDR
jgi:hypothetical protein